MAIFATELAGSPDRVNAVHELVGRLKERAFGIPARFSEAGRNLEEEENLGSRFWEALSDFLLGPGAGLALLNIEAPVCILCRSYQRQGPEVHTVRRRHGRAIKQTDFVSSLIDHGVPPSQADKKALRLAKLDAARVRAALRFMQLGNFLMWSTFCENCDCDDPFLPQEAPGELIDSLGLPFDRGDHFLLFTYQIPVGIDRHTPTIADAYGGNFYFPFRPGGRTHPVRDQNRWGRPEVVHLPITGQHLTAAIKMVNPNQPRPVTP